MDRKQVNKQVKTAKKTFNYCGDFPSIEYVKGVLGIPEKARVLGFNISRLENGMFSAEIKYLV